jgi:hypothetical protein
MTHEEIDTMWQEAMRQAVVAGEVYTRYHFAKLVAEKTLTQRTEQNSCSRCGKRTKDIHTCTPPKD